VSSEFEYGTKHTLRSVLSEETRNIHPRLRWMYWRDAMLRRRTAPTRRAQLMRNAGFGVGTDTVVHGMPRLNGSADLFTHLQIGRACVIETGAVMDLEEHITIGDNVVVGPQVMILTSSHELGPREHRAGPLVRNPVIVGDGAWIGARCVILPGVTIGAGAVLEAGSVVNKDVPPNMRFGGIPAKKLDVFADGE
jgi:maltose O-acetyltransferase